MDEAQEWCLSCGTASARPGPHRPGWRSAAAVLSASTALALGAAAAAYAAFDQRTGAGRTAPLTVAQTPSSTAATPGASGSTPSGTNTGAGTTLPGTTSSSPPPIGRPTRTPKASLTETPLPSLPETSEQPPSLPQTPSGGQAAAPTGAKEGKPESSGASSEPQPGGGEGKQAASGAQPKLEGTLIVLDTNAAKLYQPTSQKGSATQTSSQSSTQTSSSQPSSSQTSQTSSQTSQTSSETSSAQPGSSGPSSTQSSSTATTTSTQSPSSQEASTGATSALGDPDLAIDGQTRRGWTVRVQPAKAPKVDVGAALDLRALTSVGQLLVLTSTPGATVEVYATTQRKLPTSLQSKEWTKLTGLHVLRRRRSVLDLRDSRRKRFRQLLLWIVQAPHSSTKKAPGRVSINEIELYEPASPKRG